MNELPFHVEEAVKQDRLDTWRSAVDAELQDLLTAAAELTEEINTSKTATKRNYYKKKLNKVRQQLVQMLVVQNRLGGSTEQNHE